MAPNVLEIPFDLDLAPDTTDAGAQGAATEQGLSGAVHQSGGDPSSSSPAVEEEQAVPPCSLRAYVPCAPYMEPAPLQELEQKGWRRAAAEVRL